MFRDVHEFLLAQDCSDRSQLKLFVARVGRRAVVTIEGCDRVIIASSKQAHEVYRHQVRWEAFREATPQEAYDLIPDLGDSIDRHFEQFV